MSKLTIITLFCDKDFKFIPALLSRIDKKVICDFELILVDNREKFKDIDIPSVWEFYKNHKGGVLSKGYNLCQLAAKKLALIKASGDYIWFVDGDDKVEDTVSNIILDSCKSDIIIFNYLNYYSDKELLYNECVHEFRTLTDKSIFRTNCYLQHTCPTCWNKFFKKSLLDNIFNKIPEDIKVSCNEDVFLYSAALNRTESVQEIPLYFYTNFPNNGISANRKITDINRFKTITNGWKYSMELFRTEFPEDCDLFTYDVKKLRNIKYFLNRIRVSDKNIWKEELSVLLGMFSKEDIKFAIIDLENDTFNKQLMEDLNTYYCLRQFVLDSLENS